MVRPNVSTYALPFDMVTFFGLYDRYGKVTCVGQTKKSMRCTVHNDKDRVLEALYLATTTGSKIFYMDDQASEAVLTKLAKLVLCIKNHHDEVEALVRQWTASILEEKQIRRSVEFTLRNAQSDTGGLDLKAQEARHEDIRKRILARSSESKMAERERISSIEAQRKAISDLAQQKDDHERSMKAQKHTLAETYRQATAELNRQKADHATYMEKEKAALAKTYRQATAELEQQKVDHATSMEKDEAALAKLCRKVTAELEQQMADHAIFIEKMHAVVATECKQKYDQIRSFMDIQERKINTLNSSISTESQQLDQTIIKLSADLERLRRVQKDVAESKLALEAEKQQVDQNRTANEKTHDQLNAQHSRQLKRQLELEKQSEQLARLQNEAVEILQEQRFTAILIQQGLQFEQLFEHDDSPYRHIQLLNSSNTTPAFAKPTYQLLLAILATMVSWVIFILFEMAWWISKILGSIIALAYIWPSLESIADEERLFLLQIFAMVCAAVVVFIL